MVSPPSLKFDASKEERSRFGLERLAKMLLWSDAQLSRCRQGAIGRSQVRLGAVDHRRNVLFLNILCLGVKRFGVWNLGRVGARPLLKRGIYG